MEPATSAVQGEGLLDTSLGQPPGKTQASYSSPADAKTQPFVEARAPSAPLADAIPQPPEETPAPSSLLAKVSFQSWFT